MKIRSVHKDITSQGHHGYVMRDNKCGNQGLDFIEYCSPSVLSHILCW
jgi:hypothetical protein